VKGRHKDRVEDSRDEAGGPVSVPRTRGRATGARLLSRDGAAGRPHL
jgi:hypothetical protein